MAEVPDRHWELNAAYERLFQDVTDLLFRHDPAGINFETNTDEYEPEARTILPRLRGASSVKDVQRIVHEEFVRWFDPQTAGQRSRYLAIAGELWELWAASPLSRPGQSAAEHT